MMQTETPYSIFNVGAIGIESVYKLQAVSIFVITHRMKLDDAPQGYSTFMNKEDDCIKVVLQP